MKKSNKLPLYMTFYRIGMVTNKKNEILFMSDYGKKLLFFVL